MANGRGAAGEVTISRLSMRATDLGSRGTGVWDRVSKRSERRPRVSGGSRIRDQRRSRGPRSGVVRLRGAAADRGYGHVADDRSAGVARGVRMRRVVHSVVCGARRGGRSGPKLAVSVAEARLAWLGAAGTRRRSAPSRVTRHDPGRARRTRGDRRVWSRAKRLARLREPRACKPTAVHVTCSSAD